MKKFLGITCFIYSGLVLYVWIFDKLKYFLAPQMTIYLKISIVPLILMGFTLLFNRIHYKFKFIDLVLLLPVIMLALTGNSKLSLNFASSRIDKLPFNQTKNTTTNNLEINDYEGKINDPANENELPIDKKETDAKEEINDIYFDVNNESYNVLVSYLTYTEAAHKYEGTTIRVRGFSLKKIYIPGDYFMIGKYLISCCAADASYNGFVAKYDLDLIKNNTWYEIEGKLKIGKDADGYDFMYIDVVNIKEIDSKDEEEYVYPCYVYDNGACNEVNKYNLEY